LAASGSTLFTTVSTLALRRLSTEMKRTAAR